MKITLLTESELRQCVGLDQDALAVIAAAFAALSADRVQQPPILRIDVPEHHGEVDVKSAYLAGEEGFAVKISSGFFDNDKLGLPSASGMMIVLDARSGVPAALLLDNGYLTDLRTGLAGAVAARHLAPATPGTIGIIGTGAQARTQLRALALVRDVSRVLVYGRTPDKVRRYVAEMNGLFPTVEAAGLPALVKQSQLVVTTTPAQQPFLEAAWLHPGLHITAMGSDAEHKQELTPEVLRRADLLVCDSKEQCFRLGELRGGLEAGAISRDTAVVELGEVVSGRRAGRRTTQEITVCDLTGTGVQDTAIALLALKRARALGLGTEIEA
ncbi:MAG TPA: cyclodeaminase [Trueperaceae bacterium]